MSNFRQRCVVFGVDLNHVRNRNEHRVAQSMAEIIPGLNLETDMSEESLKDVFAYSLNQLPARYAQQGTIVLREPVRKEQIDAIVKEAIALVLNNPKR